MGSCKGVSSCSSWAASDGFKFSVAGDLNPKLYRGVFENRGP